VPVVRSRLPGKQTHDFLGTDKTTESLGINVGITRTPFSTEVTEGTYVHTEPTLELQFADLNVRMCTSSTSINDNPFPSVENPANNALDKSNVNRLKSTKFHILPKSLLALFCVALFDDCIVLGRCSHLLRLSIVNIDRVLSYPMVLVLSIMV